MAEKRTHDEVAGAHMEKRGRLDTDAHQIELDDEVAKELQEFEQLQTGLLGNNQEDAVNRGSEGNAEQEKGGGSDMELDDPEKDMIEVRRRSESLLKAREGQQKMARGPQCNTNVKQHVTEHQATGKPQHAFAQYRVLPDDVGEENLRGDDLIEKARNPGDNEEPRGPDMERIRAYKKIDNTNVVDPLGPPEIQHHPILEPNPQRQQDSPPRKHLTNGDIPNDHQKAAAEGRIDHPKPSTSGQSPPRNPQQTNTEFEPVAKEWFQDPQKSKDPIPDGVSEPTPDEVKRASPTTSMGPSPPLKLGWRIVRLEPREDRIPPKPNDNRSIAENGGQPATNFAPPAPNFGHPAALPYRPTQNVQSRSNISSPSPHPVIVRAPVTPHKPMVHIPSRTGEPSCISPVSEHRMPPIIPTPPKHPVYLGFSEPISHINPVSPTKAQAPTPNAVSPFKSSVEEYCVVEQVMKKRFSNSLHDESDLIGADRPKIWCPELYSYLGHYESQDWLAACNELGMFFCWPCLCFTRKALWSVSCNEDSGIKKELIKHQQSLEHQESTKKFEAWKARHATNMFKNVLDSQLDSAIRTDQIQEEIIKAGRPRFILNNEAITFQSNDKAAAYKEFYDRFQWACAFRDSRTFHCWPCLLFTTDGWNYAGPVDQWANVGPTPAAALLQHEMSLPHMSSCFELGKKEFELKKSKPTEDYRMQRFLERLVEVLCVEKTKFYNIQLSSVDYVDYLELMSCYNKRVKTVLKEISASSNTAVVELVSSHATPVLDSIEFFVKDQILNEIKNSNYVSLIFDHSSGHSDKAILSVIARYVDQGGHVRERFVKLLNVGYNSSSSTLSNEFFQVIAELQCRSKLIGYTYDGYLVKPGDIPDFNAKVRRFCPNARFFHYTEHDFLRILKQTLSHMPLCRRILQNVQELADFFDTTPSATKKLELLIKETGKKYRVDFWKSPDFVKTVFIYHTVIVEIMQSIRDNSTEWKAKTVEQAINFLDFFNDPTNRFFVTLLARIYNNVDDFTAELDREAGIDDLKMTANNTVMKMQKMGTNFINVVESACSHLDNVEDKIKTSSAISGLQEQFSDVVRAVAILIKNRTSEMESGYFKISKEIGFTPFIELKRQMLFLENVHLPLDFDSVKLSVELKFFRNSSFLSGFELSETPAQLIDCNMTHVLPELFKFVQLALTVPKKLYDGSKIPAVKQISSYIDGKKDLNSTDALLWMERETLKELRKEPEFYGKVAAHVKSIAKYSSGQHLKPQ